MFDRQVVAQVRSALETPFAVRAVVVLVAIVFLELPLAVEQLQRECTVALTLSEVGRRESK